MADSPESVSKASPEVDRRLARNFGVQKKDLENKNAKPYGIVDQTEILKEIGQVGDSLSAFLFAVAMIALIVGSIGIMNIMLITVTERTREIGIMKSLGYTNLGILSLFLLESIIVSLLGGILGTTIGGLGVYP